MSETQTPAKTDNQKAEERKAKLAAAMQQKSPPSKDEKPSEDPPGPEQNTPPVLDHANSPPPPPPKEEPLIAPPAYKIMRTQRVIMNGSVVQYKENQVISDPAVIKQLKELNIEMINIQGKWQKCPNCDHRYVDEV